MYKFFWRFEYFTCQFFECIELQFHYPFTTNIFALTNYRGRKYCDINFFCHFTNVQRVNYERECFESSYESFALTNIKKKKITIYIIFANINFPDISKYFNERPFQRYNFSRISRFIAKKILNFRSISTRGHFNEFNYYDTIFRTRVSRTKSYELSLRNLL